MNRRSFLRGLIAAPAIIAVERLMPVKPWILDNVIDDSWLGHQYLSIQSAFPIIKGDGVHDDGPGLRAFFDGLDFIDQSGGDGFRTEIDADGCVTKRLPHGTFFINGPLAFPPFPTRTMGAGLWKTCLRPATPAKFS